MHLLVFLITASCSVVVSAKIIPNQPVTETTTSDYLIGLDESLSRCGQYQIDIRDLTIRQFQEHFQSGRLTSTELTDCYLERIGKIDGHLKSVIEINPEAISLANKADNERHANSTQSLMHGIPILIKDNIGTADCMQTTAGAKALENVIPKQDADVVQRLRKVGAIILGKTNPSEWAYFRDNDIPSGWSSRGGQTVSAYILEANPSGSSTGSAVSISANLAAVSLGTETDGSIISPSARNALVGLKTTIGKVSTKGVIPLSFSSDVVGPMARTVEDAAILMGIISDIDLQECDVDISTCLPNKNFTIGVLRDPFWNISDPDIVKSFPVLEACLDNLRKNKLAVVIDLVASSVPIPQVQEQNVDVIFSHEFKFSINNYLKDDVQHCETELRRNISSLKDIIRYNELNPVREHYNQSLLKLSDSTDGLQNKTYLNVSNENRRKSTMFLESIFERDNVDAFATPCYSDEALDLYSYGAYAGYPSITVPVGVDDFGLPIGLCLLGKLNSEPVLLKLGSYIELSRSTQRPTPRFVSMKNVMQSLPVE